VNATLHSGHASARGHRRVAQRCALGAAIALVALAPSLDAVAQNAARSTPPAPLPESARPSVTLRVVDSTGLPVAGAELTVPGSSLRAVTDLAGTFRITTRTVGMISARVGRLGYRSTSVLLPAAMGEPAALTLTLVPDVPLGVVVSRASARSGVREGMAITDGRIPGLAYRRAIAGGHVFTRADLERRNPSLLSDVLRSIPGMNVRTVPDLPTANGRSRNRIPAPPRCTASIWIDGVRSPAAEVDIDNIPPHTLEAVEVYSGNASVPSEFRDTESRSACGAVLLWSRRDGGEPLRSLRPQVVDAAPGRLEELVAGRGAYTATVVDSLARLEEGSMRPVYPQEARELAGGGTVVAEFVVDSTGRVLPELIRVVGATNGLFADAARSAIPGARFRPATLGGVRVPQVVQHVFRFENDRPQ
jgi:TonB family protein